MSEQEKPEQGEEAGGRPVLALRHPDEDDRPPEGEELRPSAEVDPDPLPW